MMLTQSNMYSTDGSAHCPQPQLQVTHSK